MTEKQEENPVRCHECGWVGDAAELGHEGECAGEGCSPSSVVQLSTWTEKIQAWQDSEGQVCGRELADAGMIEPRPATVDEAARLDLEPGDTVWHLTAAGSTELAAQAAT